MAAQRLVVEQERIKKREKIANCRDWQVYHADVVQALTMWQAFGIGESDINKWGLGFCKQAPCTDYASASLTIPIFRKNKLVDIRHRLVSPADGQKYRSHWAGLPPSFFNLDAISHGERVFVVEGEKKAIVLEHFGFHPTISFPGLNCAHQLSDILAQEGTKSQRFVFLPDPGSEVKLRPLLKGLKSAGFKLSLAELIMKPDDFLVEYGGDAMCNALQYAQWV